MENKQPFDFGLIVPILIGVFSVFGICLIFLIGRITASRGNVATSETATPFQYLFLGTEPGISTSVSDEDVTVTATRSPVFLPSPFTSPETKTEEPALTKPAVTPGTVTPTSASMPPLNPGTYDEGDTRILYNGDWVSQSGVPGAYRNSLHVSNTLGNIVTMRFIGQQIRIFYQSGPSLGTISIVIDGLQFNLDQSEDETVTSEWVSALLINGTHTVTITHVSGGSINLDYVVVPDPLTTPTSTSTSQ